MREGGLKTEKATTRARRNADNVEETKGRERRWCSRSVGLVATKRKVRDGQIKLLF